MSRTGEPDYVPKALAVYGVRQLGRSILLTTRRPNGVLGDGNAGHATATELAFDGVDACVGALKDGAESGIRVEPAWGTTESSAGPGSVPGGKWGPEPPGGTPGASSA